MGQSVQKEVLRNNPNLKAANAEETITKEEFEKRKEEFKKIREDVVYFQEKYFYIINIDELKDDNKMLS